MINVNRMKFKIFLKYVFFFLLIFNISLLMLEPVNARQENIPGFSITDTVNPNETVVYRFSNNIILKISTNVKIELKVKYDKSISSREISLIINNDNPISLNLTSKPNMESFGHANPPKLPKQQNFQYQNKYNCIFQLISNVTIKNITLRSFKNEQFGFNKNQKYTLMFYQNGETEWRIQQTREITNKTSNEIFLETQLLDLEGEIEYYFTYYEISVTTGIWDWFWLIFTIIIVSIGIILVISKKDYIQQILRRTIPVEKGYHRLTLNEVLENENRNKILEIILNEPGIHFNELLRKTNLSAGNLVWHLDILETYKIIEKKRIGRYIVYFPYYQKNPLSNLDLKLNKSKLTLEILNLIIEHPGTWNNALTKRLKVDHKTVQYHVKKLIDLNLLKIVKEGRKKKFYPNLESEYFKNKKNS
ncbi:MAG: winged helix-turn-helix transcriptional regulator [Promethearchaeota archaeon]